MLLKEGHLDTSQLTCSNLYFRDRLQELVFFNRIFCLSKLNENCKYNFNLIEKYAPIKWVNKLSSGRDEHVIRMILECRKAVVFYKSLFLLLQASRII